MSKKSPDTLVADCRYCGTPVVFRRDRYVKDGVNVSRLLQEAACARCKRMQPRLDSFWKELFDDRKS